MAHPAQKLREALGMTQEAFGDAIGRSGPFVCQVEGGRDRYGRDSVLAICDLYRRKMKKLRITAEDLLRGAPADAA